MNERLKILREYLDISQEALGEKINVTRSHISSIEKGKRALTDRVITDICREFNVNEEWLRYGTEPMCVTTPNELLDQLASKYNLSDAEKQAFEAYLQLNDDDRNKISDLIQKIFAGFFNIGDTSKKKADSTALTSKNTTSEAEAEYIKMRLKNAQEQAATVLNSTEDNESKKKEKNII